MKKRLGITNSDHKSYNILKGEFIMTLTAEAISAITKSLQEEFAARQINLNLPENQELFQKAQEMALNEAMQMLEDKRHCTRDVIIITALAAAGSAATYFLAPIPEQYKIPATIGVAAVGVVADIARVTHKMKKAKTSALVHVGRMDGFAAAMGINTVKAQAAAAQSPDATTEEIVGEEADEEKKG